VRALVMELVEGPTLAERIAAGPLPLEEALGIARQIAEALEAAHEKDLEYRGIFPFRKTACWRSTQAPLAQERSLPGSTAPENRSAPSARRELLSNRRFLRTAVRLRSIASIPAVHC